MKILQAGSLLLAFGLLHADDPLASEPRLLDLNVIALDNRGQPVTDLTADDFAITDAGKPQKISFFRLNNSSISLDTSPAPGPNVFSNRPAGEPPHATVVLFDLLNEGFGTRGVAANEIERSLERLETAESLYFYLLNVDGKLLPVRGLPTNEAGFRQSVSGASPWTRQIKPILDDALRAAIRMRSPDVDVFVRTQLTYDALDRIGVELSAVPGRKNVVWVTDGVPIGWGYRRSDTGQEIDFTPQIRRLSESLDRSGIAIYPLRQVLFGRPDQIGAASGVGQTGGLGTGIMSIETLNEFADLTGGRRSSDKDIGTAVKQAISDLRFSYQLGYYPPANNWDGKFHKLHVSSSRKGVRIQAKTGYYAWWMPNGARAQDAFVATAGTALDAAEIGIRAIISGGSSDSGSIRVELQINAQDISLAQVGERYTGQLRVVAVGYLPDGGAASGPVTQVDLSFGSREREQALRDGITFSEDLRLSQDESRFRIIVFDPGSNAVGSITLPASALSRGAR